MNDALLIGLLEQQSLANYETETQPAATVPAPAPTMFSTQPVEALTESSAPAIQAQPESSEVQRLSTPQARTSQPSAAQVQKFSHIYDGESVWHIEECCKLIPDYQPAKSCANCLFATWNPATGIPACTKYNNAPVVSSYWCPAYQHPSSLVSDESEGMESESEIEIEIEGFTEKFSDKSLYQETIKEAQGKFADLKQQSAQLWVLRRYGQLYKEQHGTTEGALL